jgi:hypothetical protein
MKIIYIFICLLLTIGSCKYGNNDSGLNNFLQIKNAAVNVNIYIIPGSGCTGCISDVETLALQNKDSNNIYFVFTRINSLKIFKNRFRKIYTSKNVVVDTLNEFNYPDKNMEIYPVIYKKNKNGIKFVRYLKP